MGDVVNIEAFDSDQFDVISVESMFQRVFSYDRRNGLILLYTGIKT